MAENEPQEDPELPRDARLSALDERLDQARRAEARRTGGKSFGVGGAQDPGMRVLSVLVTYPAGSALIGWFIDRLIGTRWVVLVMLFLGFGAAGWEVWKISQQGPSGPRGKDESGGER